MRFSWKILALVVYGVSSSGNCLSQDLRSEPTQLLCYEYANNQSAEVKRELVRRRYFTQTEWAYIDRKEIAVGLAIEVLWCALGEPNEQNNGWFDVPDLTASDKDQELSFRKADGAIVVVFIRNYKISNFYEIPTNVTNTGPGSESYGTCFAVSEDEILTSLHVVEDALSISIQFQSGAELKGIIAEQSELADIAVLKVDGTTPSFLALSEMRSLALGEEVFTIGFPLTSILGSEPKFTEGSISSLSGVQGDKAYFQMSVPIQPGNSGGPVVNTRGDVVGVVAASAAVEEFYEFSGSLPQNVNWASKSDYAQLLFDPPDRSESANNRKEAIRLVTSAVCQIKVVKDVDR